VVKGDAGDEDEDIAADLGLEINADPGEVTSDDGEVAHKQLAS
jgi:hypothetical protein